MAGIRSVKKNKSKLGLDYEFAHRSKIFVFAVLSSSLRIGWAECAMQQTDL